MAFFAVMLGVVVGLGFGTSSTLSSVSSLLCTCATDDDLAFLLTMLMFPVFRLLIVRAKPNNGTKQNIIFIPMLVHLVCVAELSSLKFHIET